MSLAGKQVSCSATVLPCRDAGTSLLVLVVSPKNYGGHICQRLAHFVTGVSWCAANDDGINHYQTIPSIHPHLSVCSPPHS